ncbi:MAG: motility associated factor glycosyltransferase family protein [Proteobacteria bacterium]|nr:motility associated factor glycosyltransferase family protein [Pseudomonadota bacterium]
MEPNDKTPLPSCDKLFLETNFKNLNIPLPLRDELKEHEPSGVEIGMASIGVPLMTLNGVNVYNENDPLGVVGLEIDGIVGDDDSNVVALFGLGLGYHAEQLERRFKGHVVVFDPSLDVLATTLGARPLPLKRTVVVSNASHLMTEVQPNLQFTDRKIIAAAIPTYRQLFPEEFKLFKSTLEGAVSNAFIIENTVTARSLEWINHTVKNIPMVMTQPSVDAIGKRFAGVPAILVSAGPSLDRNIEHLHKAKGHALIMAVNASARPLDQAGVIPDIIAVVEGLDLRAQLKDFEWLKEVVLAPTLNSFPGFFELPARHIIPIADYSSACSDWFSRAYGWCRFASGGSVACTAFSILHELGCDPIVLIGQDLAYTDGYSYAGGATFGKQLMSYDKETNTLNAMERNYELEEIRVTGGLDEMIQFAAMETEAYGGEGMVHTVEMFSLFRSWFEAAAGTWANDRTLINATEGGARIREFEEVKLADVIERWCQEKVPVGEWIDEAAKNAERPDARALIEVVEEDLGAISRAADVAEQAGEIALSACSHIEKGGLGDAEPMLRKLATLEAELRQISRDNRLLDTFVSRKANQLRTERIEDCDDDSARQAINSLQRSQKLFTVISEGAKEVTQLFEPFKEWLNSLDSEQRHLSSDDQAMSPPTL